MQPIHVPQGDGQSLWPSISYKVVLKNLFLETSLEDPDLFINFLASREPHMNRTHLRYAEGGPENMRECVWEKEYRSMLTGQDLEYYRNIFAFDWRRIAMARTLSDKWDSFWERRGLRSGTLIFARSASSQVLCEIDVRFSEDYVTMSTEKLRVTIESSYDDEYDKRVANWLLMTKFWTIPFYPFPSSETGETTGLTEFLLGGGLESVIISDSEPDIADTYAIVRRCNELAHVPYVQTLIAETTKRRSVFQQ